MILLFQDRILYKVAGTYMTAEILELDIPHPTNDRDTQTYIRVETPVGPKLTTRAEIAGVMCPQCHAHPETYTEGPVELFSILEDRSLREEDMDHLIRTRYYRHCSDCNYFKEVR